MSRNNPPALLGADREPQTEAPFDLGIRLYQAVCFFALAVIFLIELRRGIGLSSILIFLVGVLAILSRLRFGPFLLLLVLTGAYFLRSVRVGVFANARPVIPAMQAFSFTDAMLTLMMLIFAVAHYRLQGLQKNLVPADTRRIVRSPKDKKEPADRRSAHLVTMPELLLFFVAMPFFTCLAQVVWIWSQQRGPVANLPLRLSRLIWIFWLVGITIFVARGLLRLWYRWQMKPEEAQLILQDTVWQETRREQRRIQSWAGWSELRHRNRH